MHFVHAHSELPLPEVHKLFPSNVQVLMPSSGAMPTEPPFLLIVRGDGDFAHLQTLVKDAERESGGKIVALPHPRNPNPLEDAHVALLRKHLPKMKKGQSMKDALSQAFALCPSPALDPDNFCY